MLNACHKTRLPPMSFSFSEHLKRLCPWKAQILRPQATPKTTNKKHTKRVGQRSRRRVVAGSGKGGASDWPQTQPPKSAGNLAWSWSLWLFRVASIPQGSRVNTLGWLSSMLVLRIYRHRILLGEGELSQAPGPMFANSHPMVGSVTKLDMHLFRNVSPRAKLDPSGFLGSQLGRAHLLDRRHPTRETGPAAPTLRFAT